MFNYKDTFDEDYMLEDKGLNDLGNFICAYYIDEKQMAVCDMLIDYFKFSDKEILKTHYGNKSRELVDDKISRILDDQIYLVLKNYAKRYPASVIKVPGIIEKCIIQSSTKGKDYNSLETIEVDSFVRKRHVAILTFLNTPQGGNIIFPQQKLGITPKRGMMLVFPNNWQFVYKVEPSRNEMLWCSAHISNINEEEKLNAMARVKMEPVSANIKYNMV